MVQMMKIDRYEHRLRAIYFKRKFPERVEEIQPVRTPSIAHAGLRGPLAAEPLGEPHGEGPDRFCRPSTP